MKSTTSLPDKLERVVCQTCKLGAPAAMMRHERKHEIDYYYCLNGIACRKRVRKREPGNAAPDKGKAKPG